MRWRKRWPGRHWDAYFSALYLAKKKEPTQWTMQVTALCTVIQWYIPMSMILLLHGIVHHWWSFCLNAEEKWLSRWSRAMHCLCSTAHIVQVQHQFQMTRETQTQSHVVHTCSLLIQTVKIPTGNHKGKKCGYLQPTPAQPSSITNILCTVTPWHYCHIYS